MVSLVLALCLSQSPGLEVRLTGVAKNAKGGAVLLVNGAPVYLEKLATWPPEVLDTQVEASGELVDLAVLPEATTSENGEIAQGTAPGTTQRVLRHPQWHSLAPVKPPETGITLRPTQRAGALLAGLAVVLGGVSLGIGLSARADVKANDPALQAGLERKYVATGVLAGVAGASAIAALVLLVIPAPKNVAPVAMVLPGGGMVGVVTWF